MQTISKNELPAIGSPLQGGFYAGLIQADGELYAISRAPKAEGFYPDTAWGEYGIEIEGANSVYDGLANTQAMAAAGYPAAQWALGLKIAGLTDWYLPARDELEICYRNLKPTADENWRYGRHGENSSAVPITQKYTATNPARTPIEAFQAGGAEAFAPAVYWSSTQHGPDTAWIQYFDDGNQGLDHKDNARPAFAVRRIKVTP
ncbi:Lcl domain-containing protein [Pseudomonas sp. LRF_L74]|uniref:Lcl domain-containing protein n=1 Tax=Pseudomonas sp. LRF_L74 TaxID=3369422 RepID=UPI003F607CE0